MIFADLDVRSIKLNKIWIFISKIRQSQYGDFPKFEFSFKNREFGVFFAQKSRIFDIFSKKKTFFVKTL